MKRKICAMADRRVCCFSDDVLAVDWSLSVHRLCVDMKRKMCDIAADDADGGGGGLALLVESLIKRHAAAAQVLKKQQQEEESNYWFLEELWWPREYIRVSSKGYSVCMVCLWANRLPR